MHPLPCILLPCISKSQYSVFTSQRIGVAHDGEKPDFTHPLIHLLRSIIKVSLLPAPLLSCIIHSSHLNATKADHTIVLNRLCLWICKSARPVIPALLQKSPLVNLWQEQDDGKCPSLLDHPRTIDEGSLMIWEFLSSFCCCFVLYLILLLLLVLLACSQNTLTLCALIFYAAVIFWAAVYSSRFIACRMNCFPSTRQLMFLTLAGKEKVNNLRLLNRTSSYRVRRGKWQHQKKKRRMNTKLTKSAIKVRGILHNKIMVA